MIRTLEIGLIGDHDAAVTAHRAIPLALARAAEVLRVEVRHEWVATDSIAAVDRVSRFDGLWCVPGSPYRSMEGALLAIRHARERGVPFLGTCGGFQHAVLEYARNVLGWADAAHAESAPDAARTVVAPLMCSLVEVSGPLRLLAGTRLAAAYGVDQATEEYHCSFGVDPRFRDQLVSGALRAAATDDQGDLRGIELDGHPFFVAVLFQPERAALHDRTPPLVTAFAAACARAFRVEDRAAP
jgi:CTP synthase (UTP-ammonia lyase)